MSSEPPAASEPRPTDEAENPREPTPAEPTQPVDDGTPIGKSDADPQAASDLQDSAVVEPGAAAPSLPLTQDAPTESEGGAPSAVDSDGSDTTAPVATPAPDQAPAPPATAAAPATPRRKILIGSRRSKTADTPTSTAPQVAGADRPVSTVTQPSTPAGPVQPPSVREPLADDLQKELETALETGSIDQILEAASAQAPGTAPDVETRQKGTVIRQHGDFVFFTLGGRHEGVASLRQFSQPPAIGVEMDVVIKSFSTEEGLYELSIPGESVHVQDWSDVTEGALVEARITGANTGGLECKVGNIRGFIPSSQIATFRVEDYAEYLDQRMLCVVTEANRRRKNLVLSRRAVLEREKEEQRKVLIESMEVGQVLEGTVRNLRDFGAFVDLGGVDGLVHVSQLSWDRVNHPSEVLEVGQKIRVKVEKLDKQTGKIGLSYRDLLEHPWEHVAENFAPDTIVTGTVSRVAKFGAFVKLAAGIEGLVHISELSYSRVPTVGSVVSEGDEVQVKILSIDTESQRMALSIKAVLPEPAPEEDAGDARQGQDDHDKRRAQRRHQKPLRGGTDRPSGGEQFGLKW